MTRTIEPMFSGDLWFLSNFHPIAFWVPQLAAVPSGEHAFNALKTTNAGERQRVLSQPSPGLAKRVGRQVTLRAGWDTGVRVLVMRTVVDAKFDHHSHLAERLLATDDLRLIETNDWHDNFWGDCLCSRTACADSGTNMLGEILMARRAELRHTAGHTLRV